MRKKKKIRLAIIGSKGIPSHVSGLEAYIQNLAVDMTEDFDVIVFCRKRYCDEITNNYKGVNVVHVPSINTKHLDAISYTFFATIQALKKKCDVFWYQALGPAITMPIVKMCKKKIVSTVHGLDWKREKFGKLASGVLKFGERCIVKNADEIITLNTFDKEYFTQKWNRETHIIPNGVKEPIYAKAEQITTLHNLIKNEYFLFMSRIVPEKGVHTLISAYKDTDVKKKLVIAGKGVHTNSYEKIVRKMAQGDDRIIFVGDVNGVVKEELYSNAYAYILPSTIEGQSIGLLEAMSYSLPCIISDIPENVEVAGRQAMTFKVGDSGDLKRCIIEAVNKELVKTVYENIDEHRFDKTLERTMMVLKKACD